MIIETDPYNCSNNVHGHSSAAFIVEPILTEIFATTDKESKYLHPGGRINNRENNISILSRHNYVNIKIWMFPTPFISSEYS